MEIQEEALQTDRVRKSRSLNEKSREKKGSRRVTVHKEMAAFGILLRDPHCICRVHSFEISKNLK